MGSHHPKPSNPTNLHEVRVRRLAGLPQPGLVLRPHPELVLLSRLEAGDLAVGELLGLHLWPHDPLVRPGLLVLDRVAGHGGAVVAKRRLPFQLDRGVRPVRDLRQPRRPRRIEGVLHED